MNWDDLRIVSAVSRTHSYTKAARLLHIDETTVSRRLARLESTFGVTLFEAVNGQRLPTSACSAILGYLDSVEHEIGDIERMLQQHEHVHRQLRLTTTPLIAERFLAPHLANFLAHTPELSLHVDTSDQNLDMSRWEADIAIRLGRPRQGSFLMRKIGQIRLCLVQGKAPDAITAGYPPALRNTPEMGHIQRLTGGQPLRLETSNLNLIAHVLQSGQVSAVVPDILVRQLDPAAPIEITPLQDEREVWLLSQPHLRDDSLARQLADWCAGLFE